MRRRLEARGRPVCRARAHDRQVESSRALGVADDDEGRKRVGQVHLGRLRSDAKHVRDGARIAAAGDADPAGAGCRRLDVTGAARGLVGERRAVSQRQWRPAGPSWFHDVALSFDRQCPPVDGSITRNCPPCARKQAWMTTELPLDLDAYAMPLARATVRAAAIRPRAPVREILRHLIGSHARQPDHSQE
jgi:hypothetical protein